MSVSSGSAICLCLVGHALATPVGSQNYYFAESFRSEHLLLAGLAALYRIVGFDGLLVCFMKLRQRSAGFLCRLL